MKYFLFVLGCQMNKSDAERVSAVLDKLGFSKTEKEEEADIIIVFTCSVRQSAVDRIYGKINQWNKIKKQRPLVTILTGCVLPQDKKKMEKSFDLIFPIEDLPKLPQLLKPLYSLLKTQASSLKPHYSKLRTQNSSLNTQNSKLSNDYLYLLPHHTSYFQAYVPIMTGCNNYCTYCVVPYVRGRERSRPRKEIIKEIKELVKRGYKEIILLGQNVNSYGHEKGKEYSDNISFINLLKEINAIPGKFWIHFISNHPKDMTEDLVLALPKLEKVAPYIHLPLQSGDDEIIKKMNRHYTARQYLKLVNFIRKTIPGVAINTDIIVGFPQETEKQFQNTLKVAKAARFDMAFTAQYSERPGTAAAKLKDDVKKEEKKQREKELTEVIKKSAFENNKKLVGTEQEILVDGKKGDYYFGRTNTWKVVKFKSDKNYIGQFIKVKITKAEPWKLLAEIK